MIREQKRMSRKAQELSITTLVLIVLGVVILVLLILGFTQGWDWIISKFSILPGQSLETVAQSCNIAAQGGLAIDFCSFKKVKVDGRNEYVNCKDSRIQAGLSPDVDFSEMNSRCEDSAALSYCQNQLNAGANGIFAADCGSGNRKGFVNNQACCIPSTN